MGLRAVRQIALGFGNPVRNETGYYRHRGAGTLEIDAQRGENKMACGDRIARRRFDLCWIE